MGLGQIEEGRRILDRALALGGRGPYALQAAIASCTPTTLGTGRRSPPSTASSPVSPIRRCGTEPAAAIVEAGKVEGALAIGVDWNSTATYISTPPGGELPAGSIAPTRPARPTRALEPVHRKRGGQALEQRLAELQG